MRKKSIVETSEKCYLAKSICNSHSFADADRKLTSLDALRLRLALSHPQASGRDAAQQSATADADKREQLTLAFRPRR